MAPSRADNTSVVQAMSSTTTCSTATLTTLKQLLGFISSDSDSASEQTIRKAADSRKPISSARSATTKASTRSRANTTSSRAQVPIKVLVEEPSPLSTTEKYGVAIETINIALRTLSDTVKQMQATVRVNNNQESSPAKTVSQKQAAKHARTNSRPLTSRSPNSPDKRTLSRQTSTTNGGKRQIPAGATSVAECAHIAFEYMRRSKKQDAPGTLDLQTENGTLSFVGKCITLGLDNIAAKELRGLKRRLDAVSASGKKPIQAQKAEQIAKGSKEGQIQKELLADLLDFGSAAQHEGQLLGVVSKYQECVMKLIAARKRKPEVHALAKHIDLSNNSSPLQITLRQHETTTDKSKAIRQFELLYALILSLCPSISTDADETAEEHVSAEVALQLQSLIYRARIMSCHACCQTLDIGKDFWRPIFKCLSAFSRRSTRSPNLVLESASQTISSLTLAVADAKCKTSSTTVEPFWSSICRLMSSIAQDASKYDVAILWMKKYKEAIPSGNATIISDAIGKVRVSRLALLAAEVSDELLPTMAEAHGAMGQALRGESSDIDALLLEVAGYRRTLISRLQSEMHGEAIDQPHNDILAACRDGVFACLRYLLRYVGPDQTTIDDPKQALRRSEKLSKARAAAPSFSDSVFLCCKTGLKDGGLAWKDFDSALQDSLSLASTLEDCRSDSYNTDNVAIKASSLYWAFHRKPSADGASSTTEKLDASKRSVTALQDQSLETRQLGSLASKLLGLAQYYEHYGNFDQSRKYLEEAISEHLQYNSITSLTQLAGSVTYEQFWLLEESAKLRQCIDNLHYLIWKTEARESRVMSFFDNARLDEDIRVLLLERQLFLYCKELAIPGRFRGLEQVDYISRIFRAIFDIYDAKRYPIRRQRIILLLTRFSHVFPSVLETDLAAMSSGCIENEEACAGSKDKLLLGFVEHQQASIAVYQALSKSTFPISQIEQSVAIWGKLVQESPENLHDRVDQPSEFLRQLELLADFLETNCMSESRLKVLSLLQTVLSSQGEGSIVPLIDTFSSISLQYLRAGYSGSAGLTLARAKSIITNHGIAGETQVRHLLAYAEYFLAIGATSKCEECLNTVKSISDQGPGLAIEKTSKVNSTLKTNQLLSHALLIASKLKLQTGFAAWALRDAKCAVKLLQRNWAIIENSTPSHVPQRGSDSFVDSTLDVSTKSNNQWSKQLTHDALKGAKLWHLVPALLRTYYNLFEIYKHHGAYAEAFYWVDSAEKIVNTLCVPKSQLFNLSLLAEQKIADGKIEDGQRHLEQAVELAENIQPCMELVRHHQSISRMWKARGEVDDELEAIDSAIKSVEGMATSAPIGKPTPLPAEDDLAAKMSDLKLDEKVAPAKTARKARGAPRTVPVTATKKKPAPKTATLKGSKPAAQGPVITESAPLKSLRSSLLIDKAITLISRDRLSEASDCLAELEEAKESTYFSFRQKFAAIRLNLQHIMKSIASDCALGMLPESTISIPALSMIETKDILSSSTKASATMNNAVAKTRTVRKVAKGKSIKPSDSVELASSLAETQDALAVIQPVAIRTASIAEFTELGSIMAGVAVFVSASQVNNGCVVHPTEAALLLDMPSINAMQRTQAISLYAENIPKEEQSAWPSYIFTEEDMANIPKVITVAKFQEDYVDVIPQPWTAFSIKLSSLKDVLYVTRLRAGETPFVLHIPLSSHSQTIDEDFGFEEVKGELGDIIQDSFESTHGYNYSEDRESKKRWWADREALDNRIHELVLNIEKIWLGGFRGVFSPQKRQPLLLARFQKALWVSLNRHLPSRQGKRQPKAVALDSRVFELFTGLPDPRDENCDIDESLIDLLYYIVDILQFKGESNAYDEVDFDSLVIDTLDALKAYHSASITPESTGQEHTILIMDKELHAFPWESLPCLARTNVSRLPSLSCLRTRILAMKTGTNIGHTISKSSGFSLLNPSGDLQKTQTIFEPLLSTLKPQWVHSTTAPADSGFADMLANESLFLYFGHGSGGQFISPRSVRSLTSCPTTWLMGCSSAALKTHGPDYEATGMVLSYLAAGAPAVVGTLWDVTDRDCDRASVKAGEAWGLWRPGAGTQKLIGIKGKRRNYDTEKSRSVVSSQATSTSSRAGRGAITKGGVKTTERVSLVEAVRLGREECYLRYLNGAALVVYGIPVFLEDQSASS
ncbi:hypothetical protein BT63DRAFT_475910 [Microthyrium microscopicum]|uniref:separase n=1 Tax=Microthyrium microscopicum TaxID=703497 RepID=A0A6A6UR33_9PEZI|nr:hypothetical protein BT63DRAFT_475910 [Microthyrium microscopicum]